MEVSIAVILTCHNRNKTTRSCIKGLQKQEGMPEFDLYVCDDGSTDGTEESIKAICPSAIILRGDGNLFWSRGMYVAMKAALENDYAFYLMVNDDVSFFPEMWRNMFQAYIDNPKAGIVGCTLSKETGRQSYGGANFFEEKKGDYIGQMIAPDKYGYAECDLANWNCILLSSEIVRRVGLIDNRYEHAMGDYDYSFRMKDKGYTLVLARHYIGYCERNGIENTFRDHKLPRRLRMRKLFAKNGFPVKSWGYFVFHYYKHGKFRNFLNPYLKYMYCIFMGKDC